MLRHSSHIIVLAFLLSTVCCNSDRTAVPSDAALDVVQHDALDLSNRLDLISPELSSKETTGKADSSPAIDSVPDGVAYLDQTEVPETSESSGSPCDSDGFCKSENPAPEECHSWVCDPLEGCLHVPLTATPCDDFTACTMEDQCLNGKCVGQPADCNDQDQCTTDGCDDETGCWIEPAPGAACDDDSPCTTGDQCANGLCQGVAVECNDDNPCTMDNCDPVAGCQFSPLTGNPCDDGTVCTTGDYCMQGQCSGKPLACNDGNPCTTDLCHAQEGCQHPPAHGALCNDGNACTDLDQCIEGQCLGQATACEDGNPCTLDSCDAQGGCIHTQPPGLPCEDGDACTTGDKCYQGQCQPGTPVECDDENPCTTNSCAPNSGCLVEHLQVNCDDNNACTLNDTCSDGVCAGQELSCADDSLCTNDYCDPATGCVFAPIEAACDDGDPCTAGDHCANGQCHPGDNPQCLAMERIVLAGDSWSTGLIIPLREALDDRGYEEVVLSWELTSKPGSKLAGWLSDSNMMNSLFLALDVEPKAELLVFTLSGNDYLGACKNGLALTGPLGWLTFMLKVQADMQTFVALAKAGRPHLRILLIGYDFLHYEMIQALGNAMPGMNQLSFNLGLIELAARGRDVALATPDMIYAHNMGLCQHTFGDYFHPPFLCPNPAFGCPEYGPGQAPFPGPATSYNPFPGGWYTYPGPLDHVPDGIHLSPAGYRAVADNSLDQGAADWIEGN